MFAPLNSSQSDWMQPLIAPPGDADADADVEGQGTDE